MDIWVFIVLMGSYSILPAVIMSLKRYKTTDPVFMPFHLFIWAGFITEVISTIAIKLWRNNAPPTNIYILASSIMLVTLFCNWGMFRRKWLPYYITGMVLFWVIDNLVIGRITIFNSYYRIASSMLYVVFAISMINKQMIEETRTITENVIFLLCICFLVAYTFKALVEALYLMGKSINNNVANSIYSIHTVSIIFINLAYFFIVMKLPKKQNFVLSHQGLA